MLFDMYPREGSPPGRFHSVTVMAGERHVVLDAVSVASETGRVHRPGPINFTPGEARSLARALMEAADAVEKGERT